jgi:magnesium transporter
MKQPARHPKHRQKPRRSAKVGLPPGTIQSDPTAETTKIRAFCYSPDAMEEVDITRPSQIVPLIKRWPNVWIDIAGLGSTPTITEVGHVLQLHPLAVEDSVHVHQRAKVDDFGDHLFIVARMSNPGEKHITEQCSFFLRTGMVVTFQERLGDSWGGIRERLRVGRGPLRSQGVDYLTYLLLDAIVDSYFPTLEAIGDRLDEYDERLAGNDLTQNFQQLHDTRHELLSLRRAIRPHRDMVNELVRDDCPFVKPETRVFLRDCYDHVIQLLDMVESYRELTADLREFQMSLVGNRMNEIMKVLTVISTLFMPLSFIVGLYGMNFNTDYAWNMPELNWRWGYLFSLSLMFASIAGMLLFFRRRGWF